MKEAPLETRRHLLATLAGTAASILAVPRFLLAQMHPLPQPLPSPNAPQNQNAPAGLDGAGLIHQPGQPTVTPLAWAEIKSDSDKLLQMATDFKAKVDETNLTATLSLSLMKQAHQIEKMAKEIQSRMRS